MRENQMILFRSLSMPTDNRATIQISVEKMKQTNILFDLFENSNESLNICCYICTMHGTHLPRILFGEWNMENSINYQLSTSVF